MYDVSGTGHQWRESRDV